MGYYHGFETGACSLYNQGKVSLSESFSAVSRFISNYSDSTDESIASYKTSEIVEELKEIFPDEASLADTCRYYFGQIETPD